MKPTTRAFYESAVERVVRQVVEGLDQALELDALAREATLSPFHFHRIFRGMLGETPLQMHRRLRLERAAWMLIDGEEPVTKIAFDAGYDTHEAFTRAFRAEFTRSPSQFRIDAPKARAPYTPIRLPSRSGVHFDPDPDAQPYIHFPTGESNMDVEIEELPELSVAALRHVGPYHRIGEVFMKLGEIVGRSGLFEKVPPDLGPWGPTAMLGMYHDHPENTPEDELRSDAALAVSPDAELPEPLVRLEIPAGRYARYSHIGPYEGLPEAWSRLMGEWLPNSGECPRDAASLEVYRNDPSTTKPEELHTDLYVALE